MTIETITVDPETIKKFIAGVDPNQAVFAQVASAPVVEGAEENGISPEDETTIVGSE